MSGYVRKFNDRSKNKKLMCFCMVDDKLLEKYKTIWSKIEDLQNIELNALPICDDIYIKSKMRTYDDKVYTNFHYLNLPEFGVECESVTVVSIGFLLFCENKYYLQVYLDGCASQTMNEQIVNHLDNHLFDSG